MASNDNNSRSLEKLKRIESAVDELADAGNTYLHPAYDAVQEALRDLRAELSAGSDS